VIYFFYRANRCIDDIIARGDIVSVWVALALAISVVFEGQICYFCFLALYLSKPIQGVIIKDLYKNRKAFRDLEMIIRTGVFSFCGVLGMT
jgi:hypothetical protein